ncbi:hypothetical protein XENOCAPTIV_015894, partial [Xenoophorus captivus]
TTGILLWISSAKTPEICSLALSVFGLNATWVSLSCSTALLVTAFRVLTSAPLPIICLSTLPLIHGFHLEGKENRHEKTKHLPTSD